MSHTSSNYSKLAEEMRTTLGLNDWGVHHLQTLLEQAFTEGAAYSRSECRRLLREYIFTEYTEEEIDNDIENISTDIDNLRHNVAKGYTNVTP